MECVCGDVGEGIFGEGYEMELVCWEPARCCEFMTALSAALVGSSVCSAIVLSCEGCVGEAFLGVAPIRILRCEYCRLGAPPDDPGGGVGAGGDSVDES